MKKKKKKMTDEEMPAGLMFLEMLIEAGKVPQAVVVANTEKKEELYNEEEREEILKNLPFGD